MTNKHTVFIVGTTASGKTSAAIQLAKKVHGEIVCADSQTLRKHLDIGTAKPSLVEQDGISHHMLDVIEPYERYNVARFKADALEIIKEIRNRNNVPIIVGGTGLYIDALFYNYDFSKDVTLRSNLEKLSVEELQQIIMKHGYEMPQNRNNPRHLIGVVARANDNPKNTQPIPGAVIYGLKRPDNILKQRIDERIESMFDQGIEDEVKRIIDQFGPIPVSLDAIGYPIVYKYLEHKLTLEETKSTWKTADWRYAKRQKAWFKRNKYIQWFTDGGALITAAVNAIESN